MGFLVISIQKAIGQGINILYGAPGEMMTGKSGNLNLDIPGMMHMGSIAGLIGAFLYKNGIANPGGLAGLLISFACAFVCTVLGGLVCSVLAITLRANQDVAGLALITLGADSGDSFGGSLVKLAGGMGQISVAVTDTAYKTSVPGPSKLGVIGQIFFSYRFLTYLGVTLAPALAFFLAKTRRGLGLRAVGESPATADAAGISVAAYKYLATCLGGGINGLGGSYSVMEYSDGIWTSNGFDNRGWLVIALIISALWRPVNAIWGPVLLGGLYILYLYVSGLDREAQEILKVLPYVVTIMILVVASPRKRRKH